MSSGRPHDRTAAAVVWFRADLRLADNPALCAAVATGRPVVCVYVHDETSPGLRPIGAAARWWLGRSLAALDQAIARKDGRERPSGLARGSGLVLRRGPAAEVIPALVAEAGAASLHINRRYDAGGIAVDAAVTARLAAAGVAVSTHQATLLAEPGTLVSSSGEFFRVFTPFWRALRRRGEPRAPLAAPARIAACDGVTGERLADWALEPTAPDWAGGLRAAWTPGEAAATARLAAFIDAGLAGYARKRDRPDLAHTSRLSPHLRFGEVSPFQLWHAAKLATEAAHGARPAAEDFDKLASELGWREFSHHLLHGSPDLARRSLQPRFDAFPWLHDRAALRAWQRGMTGYPIVDAGMRELWRSGWMHNRVRMVVASFLVKHLLIDWREGEAWLWDTLVDADPANNPASWQWVAGSGADAAPYFRIFNPVLQGEKFDPDGGYVRRHLPELARLPNGFIHKPWEAADSVLADAGVRLGQNYPAPIVDHGSARRRALAAFAALPRNP
jgi:deoxyribodipyrimidine photo-lyase